VITKDKGKSLAVI